MSQIALGCLCVTFAEPSPKVTLECFWGRPVKKQPWVKKKTQMLKTNSWNMRWFLADGNQSWLCEATKGRNTRPSVSKLFAEFCSFYFHMQTLIYLSETKTFTYFLCHHITVAKWVPVILRLSFSCFHFKKYFARMLFLDISLQGLMLNRINLVRVEESVQLRLLDQRRGERQEITCGVGFRCLLPDREPTN